MYNTFQGIPHVVTKLTCGHCVGQLKVKELSSFRRVLAYRGVPQTHTFMNFQTYTI